jgi:uncharacterized protein YggE
MKRNRSYIGVLILLVLVLSACSQAGTAPTLAAGEMSHVYGGGGISPSGQFTEGIVVVGTGTASAEPEVAQVTFGIELRGDDPAALVDEAAQKMDRAIAAAQELGAGGEDIQTTGYNLWVEPIYDPETGAATGEVVYHLSHYVQVNLRDLDQVGRLLASVIEAGANTISGVSFAVENPEALVEEARQQALKDADDKAEAMAEALGTIAERPILVMEVGGGYPTLADQGIGGAGGAAVGVAAPSVSPGVLSVSVSVQVVYKMP